MLDSLAGSHWFSSLDARSGFYQQEIDEKSRHKTAFITHDGLYEWTRLPMGLNNAPASFARMMMSILTGVTWTKCLVYLDDVLVFTKGSFEDHLKDLDEVCNKLRGAGLTMKLSKCTFATQELIHLGHKISRDGIACDPEKIAAIAALVAPRTKSAVRSFLGTVGYYRRFVENFSLHSAPLEKYLEGTRKGDVELSPEALLAWQHLKAALMTEPVLAFPEFSSKDHQAPPFVVKTDACDTQIGAVLVQGGRPVAYLSRRLRGAELNWHTTEKECYAVVWALKKWRPYLLDEQFVVETDHAALLALNKKMGATPRLVRWALELQAFHFSLAHVKGKDHLVPDGMSRLAFDETINPRVPVGTATRCEPGRSADIVVDSEERPRGALRNHEASSTADACFALSPVLLCRAHRTRRETECTQLGCDRHTQRRVRVAGTCTSAKEFVEAAAFAKLAECNAGIAHATKGPRARASRRPPKRHRGAVATAGWNATAKATTETLRPAPTLSDKNPVGPGLGIEDTMPWAGEEDTPPFPTFGLPWPRPPRQVRKEKAMIARAKRNLQPDEFNDNHVCPGPNCRANSKTCKTASLAKAGSQSSRHARQTADMFAGHDEEAIFAWNSVRTTQVLAPRGPGPNFPDGAWRKPTASLVSREGKLPTVL